MHELGRVDMEKAFPGVESFFVESVPEGPDSVRVMETFIRNGARLVFATSFGYMDFVQEVAAKNPEVIFMHCSGTRLRTMWVTTLGGCTRQDTSQVSLQGRCQRRT